MNPLLVCNERRGVPVTILYRVSRFEEVFTDCLTLKMKALRTLKRLELLTQRLHVSFRHS